MTTRAAIETFALSGAGIMLAAEAHGPENGELVLFLHGGGQSRSAWRSAAEQVGGQGYRAVSVDLRGHGTSDWSPDGDYHVERHVADIRAVIGALGPPAVLVGASLGGHVTLLTAAAAPEIVRAIILCDVTPFLDETVADGLRQWLRGSSAGFATLEEAAAMLGSGGTPRRPPSERLREHLREGEDGRLYWRWDTRVVEDRFVRHAGEGGLFAQAAARLRTRTLVLRAGDSTVTSPAQLVRFREVSPHIETMELPGIGHMLTGDSNRAYAAPILAFLAKLAPVGLPRS